MLKTVALVIAVQACTAAALFNFYAASCILHTVPGWEIAQAGVAFVGICYAVAALGFVSLMAR